MQRVVVAVCESGVALRPYCDACLLQGSEAVNEFIDKLNAEYEQVHLSYENSFWGTKVASMTQHNAFMFVWITDKLNAYLTDHACEVTCCR